MESTRSDIESVLNEDVVENDFVDENNDVPVFTKSSQRHPGDMLACMMELKCDGSFCDVTIKSGDFTVKAHKVVLASATDYFKAMFKNETKEAESGIVDFSKISPEIVKQCIEFIYSGTIEVSMNFVRELLDSAEMMQLSELSVLCVELLAENMDMKSCAEVVTLSYLYDKKSLNKPLCNFLKQNFVEFAETDDFASLDSNTMIHCIMSLCNSSQITEEQKWNSILTWTNADLEERECTFPTLFKLLNLQQIPEEFVKCVICTNHLVETSNDCLLLIRDMFIDVISAPITPLTKHQEPCGTVVFRTRNKVVGCTITHATMAAFPSAMNINMDVIYYRNNIFVGTGLKIYKISNGNWSHRDIDLNAVEKNSPCVTCPNCLRSHWFLGIDTQSYMIEVVDPTSRWPHYVQTFWTTQAPETKKLSMNSTLQCHHCDRATKKSINTESCYNRCIGVENSIYMLTRNYVIEYDISSTEIIHHNVLVGSGDGFFLAASEDYIFVLGGNGTERRAVKFGIKTKHITHMPNMKAESSFGRALFQDNQLTVAIFLPNTNEDNTKTIYYNEDTQEWCDSIMVIPVPPVRVNFG